MNRTILLLTLLLSQVTLNAQTYFNGLINTNTTWLKANSPYVINGPVLIEQGATLTIEPGVTIKLNNNHQFFCEGNMIAIGTATDSISFISDQPNATYNAWHGLEFRHDFIDDTATFSYCNFKSARNAIDFGSGIFTLTNSSFAYSGVMLGSAKALIANNRFWKGYFGIELGYTDCEITNNEFNGTSHGVYVKYDTKVKLRNNTFIYNGNGITVNNGNNTFDIADNMFLHNKWSAFAAGSDIILSSPMKGNVFAYGVNALSLRRVTGVIEDNSIKHNKVGITIGAWNSQGIIVNNCIDSNAEFNMINDSGNDIVIPNNWWGTADSLELQSKQRDFYDDFVHGKTDLWPILPQSTTACKYVEQLPFPTGVADAQTSNKTISVYPNPFHTTLTINLNGARVKGLSVYNIVGKMIATVDASGKNEVTVDLSQYPAGMYIYQGVYDDNTGFSGKLVKE